MTHTPQLTRIQRIRVIVKWYLQHPASTDDPNVFVRQAAALQPALYRATVPEARAYELSRWPHTRQHTPDRQIRKVLFDLRAFTSYLFRQQERREWDRYRQHKY